MSRPSIHSCPPPVVCVFPRSASHGGPGTHCTNAASAWSQKEEAGHRDWSSFGSPADLVYQVRRLCVSALPRICLCRPEHLLVQAALRPRNQEPGANAEPKPTSRLVGRHTSLSRVPSTVAHLPKEPISGDRKTGSWTVITCPASVAPLTWCTRFGGFASPRCRGFAFVDRRTSRPLCHSFVRGERTIEGFDRQFGLSHRASGVTSIRRFVRSIHGLAISATHQGKIGRR